MGQFIIQWRSYFREACWKRQWVFVIGIRNETQNDVILELSKATQFKKLPHGKIKMRLLCARRYIWFLGFHPRRWKQEFIKLYLCHFSYLLLISYIVLWTKCVWTWHWRTQRFFDPSLRSPLSTVLAHLSCFSYVHQYFHTCSLILLIVDLDKVQNFLDLYISEKVALGVLS